VKERTHNIQRHRHTERERKWNQKDPSENISSGRELYNPCPITNYHSKGKKMSKVQIWESKCDDPHDETKSCLTTAVYDSSTKKISIRMYLHDKNSGKVWDTTPRAPHAMTVKQWNEILSKVPESKKTTTKTTTPKIDPPKDQRKKSTTTKAAKKSTQKKKGK